MTVDMDAAERRIVDWPFLIGGPADGEEIPAEALAKRSPVYTLDEILEPMSESDPESRIKETTYEYRKMGMNGTNLAVRCFVHQGMPTMIAVQKLWEVLFDKAVAKSNGSLIAQIRFLERKILFLEAALQMMVTAGSVTDDFLGEVYLKAGGGYEGLQAVAEKALKTAAEMSPTDRSA